MRKRTILLGMTVLAIPCFAQKATTVDQFLLAGPYPVTAPVCVDTVNVQGQKFNETSLLDGLQLTAPTSSTFTGFRLPSLPDKQSVGLLTFYLNNADYVKGKVSVKGPHHYKLFVDGQENAGDLALAPDHHTLSIKFLSQPNDTDSIAVSIDANTDLRPTVAKAHPYMVHDLTDGRRVRDIRLSANGTYALFAFQTTERGGESRWEYEVRDIKTQRLVARPSQSVKWMPRTTAYIEEVWENGKRNLYKVEPVSGQRDLIAADVPKGGYTISPTEDYLVITAEDEGPKEDDGVFEVTEMDDRQPGWRNRSYLLRFDLGSHLSQRITFGSKGEYLHGISADGRHLLVTTTRTRLSRRPTTVTDLFIIDAYTLDVDTVITAAEFIDDVFFSPDGRQLLFMGCPEAFDRVGCQLPDSLVPSMMEHELFLYDLASRQVKPLTRDFDPSVERVEWSQSDGRIYFSAEDRDYVRLFTLNPATGAITRVPIQGDYAYRFDLATQAPVIGYLSYETMAPASAYVTNLKSLTTQFFDGKTALGDAELGTCQDWNFTNSNGDTVYGRLYLPKDFDPAKKYPLIVYYYGGCSPVSRYFESPYAPQMWTSLGYVAYILQPSGATGFGQEWASRHVNTAGGGLAQHPAHNQGGTPAGDIIEGVKRLCEEHPYINKEKIGCMGASYGGFMTQYLQTVTDIFACAVSHAGISNHTSYWGEGYWGYNYSEVSMAGSYPWSDRELYVDRSPLFNADKIHTPLLLLHGNADTNVPLVESLQMFTALKLLGREVALVEVEGQNHHILDYAKRERWLSTQMAWFQRWLKDDPTWWDALYPKKSL